MRRISKTPSRYCVPASRDLAQRGYPTSIERCGTCFSKRAGSICAPKFCCFTRRYWPSITRRVRAHQVLDGSLEDARILGAGNNLQIETNVPETLPMNGDQEMISLTVQNLVENAVKYNRRGGKILISAEKHDHVVQICVGNSGPGIPPERAPNVFGRFYRARGDEQTPGHGLGLSIARELARAQMVTLR